MSPDFVTAFVEKHGVNLGNNEFLDDSKVIASFFEEVLQSKGLNAKVTVGPEMMLVIGDGIEMETTLHTTLTTFGQNAETVENMLLLLRTVGDAFLKNIQPSYDKRTVWLALMSAAQVDEMNADFKTRKDGSERPEDQMPILYRQTADLYVSPVIESSAGLVPVTERLCRTLGVGRNDLFDIGLDNLRDALGRGAISVSENADGLFSVHSVLPPAGALFLVPEFWNEQEQRIGAPPLVRIIHGDTLVFASSKGGRQPKLAYRSERGTFTRPISDDVFIWNGRDFTKYRSAA